MICGWRHVVNGSADNREIDEPLMSYIVQARSRVRAE